MKREETLTVAEAELVLPEVYQGMQRWDAPEVAEIVDMLHNGYPPLGWEGDPRLALYQQGEAWMLYRLEHDGRLQAICRSKPNTHLDVRLIKMLVDHDQRRGFDPVAFVEKHAAR